MNYCKNCKNKKEEIMKFCNDCGIELIKYNQLEHECEDEKFKFKIFKKKIKNVLVGSVIFCIVFIFIVLLSSIGQNNKKTEIPTPQEFLNEKEVAIDLKETVMEEIVDNVEKTIEVKVEDKYLVEKPKLPEEDKIYANIDYYEFMSSQMVDHYECFDALILLNSHYLPTVEWKNVLLMTVAQVRITNSNIRNYNAPEELMSHHKKMIDYADIVEESMTYYIMGIEENDLNYINKSKKLMNEGITILEEAINEISF